MLFYFYHLCKVCLKSCAYLVVVLVTKILNCVEDTGPNITVFVKLIYHFTVSNYSYTLVNLAEAFSKMIQIKCITTDLS